MTLTLLKNAQVITVEKLIPNGFVLIEDHIIVQAGGMIDLPALDAAKTKVIDLEPDYFISAGFIDMHIHGAGGADVMDATEEALNTIAQMLPKEGTTSFLATTMTQEHHKIESALINSSAFNSPPGQAEILGVHLEGPFINQNKAGAQPREYMVEPNIQLFKKWQAAADNQIKVVTYAPEIDIDMAFTRYLAARGVIASIGHSDAQFSEVCSAVDAGATNVTHLFNGMRGMHHREAGVAGAALLIEELTAEIIADGIHVTPEMVQLVYKTKGMDQILLITDSMRAKYLREGEYDLGGQRVTVKNKKAQLADGTLAGSILKMNEAVKNIIAFAGADALEAIQSASMNPAKNLGIYDRKGSIASGKDADLVVLDKHLNVVMTICRGEIGYSRES
ncbi:N-acetylglucosamine-6-phosphate deacetylase [Cytobacillus purgationiresistens]|uniref:N-acetylglucosamine-6-phosphate deacetylase n=1 Tax=Cytobacillus purgationiresistens TaxID=863449 RepID=A0ABU0ACR9_9BACI|nr:N-acetylglucosamine-6-phosphate deacetylase [Cytobacillus purgationiresistens]MDQ0269050.1 N-acetylglucosamine-6-phosphate deacetylase [Cytobacillus purgationiresistens]